MIEFKCNRFDKYCNPIVSDAEIDAFAHAVLADYRPELLNAPGKLNYEHFLERYLGATVIFHDIYYDNPNNPVFAVTAFDDGIIRVFDRENMSISQIFVEARSVIIDNSVNKNRGLALFTGLHEGGHLLMHSNVPSMRYDEIGFMCTGSGIDNFNSLKDAQCAAEWREHHADYFASAMAMPNSTFIPFIKDLFRKNRMDISKIIMGTSRDLDYIAKNVLPVMVASVYGVSKRAAFVKLRKSGFIVY